jgi:hypothetical protein
LRDAAKQFLQQMAELIIKLYVMQPILDSLFGRQGTAGGGVLGPSLSSLFGGATDQTENIGMTGSYSGFGQGGGLLSSLFGSSDDGGVENIGMTASYADFGQSSGGIADIFSSIGSFFGFAEGGKVGGRGNRDTVLARLTPGEVVMNRAAVARHGALLDAMNNGMVPGYATGGPVGRVSIPRLPQITAPRAAAPALHNSATFNIDARGAQEGVADQIDAKIRESYPAFLAGAMQQFDQHFPTKLHSTLQSRY